MWYIVNTQSYLCHHGVKGQKWGVRNGPPYPLSRQKKKSVTEKPKDGKIQNVVEEALRSGRVTKKINREKQLRHTKDGHAPGRSYLDGDLEFAQHLVDKLSGTGKAKMDRNGNWIQKEAVVYPNVIGTYVNNSGEEEKTNKAMIVYSKTGTHIYPRKRG